MGWVSAANQPDAPSESGGLAAILVVTMAALAGGIATGTTATCDNPQRSQAFETLPGSSFEIDTNANLKVDDHWTVSTGSRAERRTQVPLGRRLRSTTRRAGLVDGSFGNGTKEDTAQPSVVDGGIPPNKSDLKAFGLFTEKNQAEQHRMDSPWTCSGRAYRIRRARQTWTSS